MNGTAVPLLRVSTLVPSAHWRLGFALGVLMFLTATKGMMDWRHTAAFQVSWFGYVIVGAVIGYDVFIFTRWRENSRLRFFGGFQLAHLYLWGLWGWDSPVTFSVAWLFDEVGHALWSFTATLMLLPLLMPFHKKRGFMEVVVIGIVFFTGFIAWEQVEGGIDFCNIWFGWSAGLLQKDNADTMWDMRITLFFAWAAVISQRWIDGQRILLYPSDEKAAHERRMTVIRQLVEEIQERVRKIMEELRGVREYEHDYPVVRELLRNTTRTIGVALRGLKNARNEKKGAEYERRNKE